MTNEVLHAWSRDSDGLTGFASDTRWDDVIGHGEVKDALEELLILPLQHPDLYKQAGLEQGGTKGVLLAGTPTRKKLL